MIPVVRTDAVILPHTQGVFQDPQWVPETGDCTDPYRYTLLFPICAYLCTHRNLQLLFGTSEGPALHLVLGGHHEVKQGLLEHKHSDTVTVDLITQMASK